MVKHILKISLFTFFALALRISIAQNFPVRVTPILAPPYTPFLTDYIDPGSDKLTLQIVLNDITIPEYRCKLRLTIEGVNISITTNPNFAPLPLVLSGGVPEILYGSDIFEYFKNSNLIFKGITQQEFEKKGNQLPEGIYRFSFEVLDYNRGTVVSNKGNATAWMLLNDPPFVNLPVNNAKLKPLNPQNIVFQWTPRHRGSPNAAFTTEYDVKMVEIWPKGRNPYDAINTSLPIFETTTDATMIVYGPAETPLVLGREYALQIRARDTGGKDLFKNNGYSEVIRFVYGDECPMPSGILTDDIGTAKARIRWQGNGQNSGYVVRYREKVADAQWFEENTDQMYFNLSGMRQGATYEYQLCGECEAFRSEYTKGQTLTTLAENPNAFVCGNPNALVPIDGSGPLPALMSNDFIKAGGFDVVVTHATGSNGKFSGDGLATVPWFNDAKVRVTFENISVNKSYQLTSGFINSRWNKDSKLLLTDENQLTENNTPSSQLRSDVKTFEADTTVLIKGTMIVSVFSDSEGNIVVQTTDGGSVTLEKGKSYAVADEVGNGYLVDKEGKVTKTTATDAIAAGQKGSREYSNDPNVNIRFAKSAETKYGFDEKRECTLPQNYQQTENGKWVAWKALSTGQEDFVQAISEGTTDINKIRFQLEGVTPQVITPTGQSLTLTGKANGTIEELLAYSPQQDTSKQDLVAGKLNVVSYESSLSKRLVLVAVNDTKPTFNATSLGLELNKIYSQAVTSWEVNNAIQTLKVDGVNENALDDGGSGLLSNYTSEMKQVLNAYLNGNQMADDTYYMFIVNNARSGNKLGYMPRSKQAGFIFLNPHKSETEIIHTIAHELGHGVFRLRHTFSEEEFIAAQGTTDNLMDYAGGIALNKYQWDYVHNPEGVIGLFEGDEEGASICTWWYQSVTSYLWPNESDKVLEGKASLFDHVRQNFDTYFTASQTENKDITGYTGWSARKSSFTKKNNLTLVERVVNKFLKELTPSFDLSNKGIFLSEYAIEGKTYKVVLYSELQNISLEKTQVDDLCDLVDHEVVKIVLENDYILISFFKEKMLQMTLQILASEDEDAELWLKYLGILIKGHSIEEKIKDYWNQFIEIINPSVSDTVVVININTVLIAENELNSLSSFSIDDGKVTGYFIERGKGTVEEERQQGSKKRIPENSYEFVNNDCVKYYDDLGRERRSNCANEFRLITTPEKSGTRDGILIHTGSNYEDVVGCLIPVGSGYGEEDVSLDVAGELKTLKKYTSNGTSLATLTAIKNHILLIEEEAIKHKKTVRMFIDINR